MLIVGATGEKGEILVKQINKKDIIAALQYCDSCEFISVQEVNGKLYLEVNEELVPFILNKIAESTKYIVYKDNEADPSKPFYILKGFKNTFTKDIKKAELFDSEAQANIVAELCGGKVKIST
jgi:hypothetical protein